VSDRSVGSVLRVTLLRVWTYRT